MRRKRFKFVSRNPFVRIHHEGKETKSLVFLLPRERNDGRDAGGMRCRGCHRVEWVGCCSVLVWMEGQLEGKSGACLNLRGEKVGIRNSTGPIEYMILNRGRWKLCFLS